MEIQSSSLGFSLDTFGSAGSQSGTKDDMFAQMIARMMDNSSTQRQESTQQTDSRRSARTASQDEQAARAAEKTRAGKAAAEKAAAEKADTERADAGRAAEKAGARSRLTAQPEPAAPRQPADTPAPRAADTERPARTDAGRTADRTTAKPPAKADGGKAADKTDADAKARTDTDETGSADAADASADATDGTVPADITDGPIDGEIVTDESADDGADTVVIEAQITIVETTVEVITPTQHFAMSMTQGTGSLSVSMDGGETDGTQAAKGTGAMAAVQDAAAQNGAQAAGARPLHGPMAGPAHGAAHGPANGLAGGPTDGKAPPLPADAKPEDAAAKPDAAATPDAAGALMADALPTDDSVELPENIAGLFQNAGQGGGAVKDAAAKGQGGANGNPHGQQQQPSADPAALNAQTAATQAAAPSTKAAFEAVAAAVGVDSAQPVAATHEAAAADPAQAVIASVDGVKTTAAAEGTRGTAAMHPSRGSAAMPQGVPDQIAVNIHKAVKDGKDHFSIRLNPEDLGRIDIRLEIAQDGRLQANISVEKAQTLELLQRDQRSLESALTSAGLKADSDSLNFSLHGDGQSFAGENNAQDGGRRGRGRGAVDPDEQAEQDAAIIHTLTLGPGRFDVRV